MFAVVLGGRAVWLVPLSFVGVIVGMLICQFDFSLAAFIGLVSPNNTAAVETAPVNSTYGEFSAVSW